MSRKRVKYVSASVTAVSDRRYKGAKAPTMLQGILITDDGRACWWDEVTGTPVPIGQPTKAGVPSPASIRTRSGARNK